MNITHSVEINAPKEAIFALYRDVEAWPIWDSETTSVHLPEGLNLDAKGWLKPRKGPKAHIRVAEVMEGKSFTIEATLPLCRMRFGHELKGKSVGQTTVTHWVSFDGPLAFLFRRVIGNGIDLTLPETLCGLKRTSEAMS
jgi:hypothetical protein